MRQRVDEQKTRHSTHLQRSIGGDVAHHQKRHIFLIIFSDILVALFLWGGNGHGEGWVDQHLNVYIAMLGIQEDRS